MLTALLLLRCSPRGMCGAWRPSTVLRQCRLRRCCPAVLAGQATLAVLPQSLHSADSVAAALQSSRDVRRSATFHSVRGQGAPRRDPALDFLQEAIAERNPELRSLHLDKLVGRGSFGRVYKGVS